MFGIFDRVIGNATGRDVWDAPASWIADRGGRHLPDRRSLEKERTRLRRAILLHNWR